ARGRRDQVLSQPVLLGEDAHAGDRHRVRVCDSRAAAAEGSHAAESHDAQADGAGVDGDLVRGGLVGPLDWIFGVGEGVGLKPDLQPYNEPASLTVATTSMICAIQ